MTFDAKFKSFKMIAIILSFVGVAWGAECHAERNPVSLHVKQSLNQDLLSPQVVAQVEAFKKNRQHTERRWNHALQFMGQQMLVVSDQVVSSRVGKWWQQQRISPNKIPLAQQSTDLKPSIAINPAALMAKCAANLSAIQWWQVSSKTMGLLQTAQRNVAQARLNFLADSEEGLMRFASSSSNQLGQQLDETAAVVFLQSILTGNAERLATVTPPTAVNVNEEASQDPYWSYYSDCDFWGVDFN